MGGWQEYTWTRDDKPHGKGVAHQDHNGMVKWDHSWYVNCKKNNCNASKRFWQKTFQDMNFLGTGWPIGEAGKKQRVGKGDMCYFRVRLERRYEKFMAKWNGKKTKKVNTRCVQDIYNIMVSPMWYYRLNIIATTGHTKDSAGLMAKWPVRCSRKSGRQVDKRRRCTL